MSSSRCSRRPEIEPLPAALVDLGIALFGSNHSLQAILRATRRAARITLRNGACLWLASHQKDDSMARLTAEVPLDGYRLRSLPSSGGRMVDVGSNLGDQSIAAHLLRPSLQVLAIEPVPLTYFYLRLNLHLNRVQLLSLADFAHGQRAGVAPLHGAIVARPNANALTVPIRWSSGKSQDAAVDLASAGGTAPGGAAQMWATSAVPALHLPTLLAPTGC